MNSTLVEVSTIDTGDTAFIILSGALVLLMTPGLGLFYGGMVSNKNVRGRPSFSRHKRFVIEFAFISENCKYFVYMVSFSLLHL